MDEKKIRKVMRKTCIERSNICLLKDEIRKLVKENIFELVDVGATNLRRHFKDGCLKECDEVFGNKWGMRSKGTHGSGMRRQEMQYQERHTR